MIPGWDNLPRIADLSFQWPALLGLLGLAPLLGLAWVRGTRAGAVGSTRFPGLSAELARQAPGSSARRIGVSLLWLCSLTLLALAAARPQATVSLPAREATLVLAIDVSGSMRADDLKPTRLAAAKQAARAFVERQPAHVRIGLVSFAGSAALSQSPTRKRAEILAAIDRLQPQRGTALGAGLVVALSHAIPQAGIDVEKALYGRSQRRRHNEPEPPPAPPMAPGSNHAAAVVLLSDGQPNTGLDPSEAAKLAARHGVRVYTIGVATPEGATLSGEGWSVRTRLDEDTLKRIAATTHAEYFRAGSIDDLHRIHRSLGARLVMEIRRSTELSGTLAALGGALALLAAVLGLRWFNRVI